MDGHPLSFSEDLEGGDPLSSASPLFSPLISSREAGVPIISLDSREARVPILSLVLEMRVGRAWGGRQAASSA